MNERVKLGYRPGLDGLRAVAVAGVIGVHYYDWPTGGASGVDLFFVLSGFLITTLLLEEWGKRGTISLRRFYLRRALRLFPALWLFLLVRSVLALQAGRFHATPLLLGLTYTTNIAGAARGGGVISGLSHLWSLGNEEQFYLLWPLLLVVLLHRRRPAAQIASLAATLALVVVVAHDALDWRALVWFRFDALLVGCVAGVLFASRHHAALRAFCCRPAVAAAASTILVCLMVRPPLWRFDVGAKTVNPLDLVFAIAAAITIVWVVEGCPGFAPARWAFASPPVAYTGRISYGLYLWHPFVLEWFLWGNGGHIDSEVLIGPLSIVVTFLVASASYWLVERPFLRLKWRLSATGSHDADAHWAMPSTVVDAVGAA